MSELVKTVVWYSVDSGGDGSAYPSWYLELEHAEYVQDNADEGWGESCTGSVETYEGSDIHESAKDSSVDVALRIALADIADVRYLYASNKVVRTYGPPFGKDKAEEIQDILDLKFPGFKVKGL